MVTSENVQTGWKNNQSFIKLSHKKQLSYCEEVADLVEIVLCESGLTLDYTIVLLEEMLQQIKRHKKEVEETDELTYHKEVKKVKKHFGII